jgi:hypothetical protein
MRWGVYARDGFEGAVAFRDGLLKIGEFGAIRSVSDAGPDCFEPFDVVVIFGLQGKGPIVKSVFEKAGVPVVIVDYGYLKRTNHAHDWRTGHWQVSVGALNALPQALDSSRWDALGLEVVERGGDPNGYTLLCVQTTGDASHGMDADGLQAWCDEQSARWPGLLVRPHPLQTDRDYGLPRCRAESLADALAGARLVVTANSNTGTDALLAGVPVVATRPGAAWAELSGEELPSMADRLNYFHRCAWGQWTWDEFRAGLPQRFLMEQNQWPKSP